MQYNAFAFKLYKYGSILCFHDLPTIITRFESIVLMVLVDPNYSFLWSQVEDVGSSSDGQIWNYCELHRALQDGVLGVPEADPLPGDYVNTPYYVIGDDAFALRTGFMKPFPRRGLFSTSDY